MSTEACYLRQDVAVEPLVDHWYAWSHLIPPATEARNIVERHLKIMDSYISAPQIHANAVKNPKMLGGPFIDYGGKRIDEIRRLRDETKTKRARLIELAGALEQLDAQLRTHQGLSLEQHYASVPAPLRGLVELVYDRNNHATFRLVEPLVYRSDFYDPSGQTLMLSVTHDDRPFVLSTPRLEDEHHLHLKVPFNDERVDRLFGLTSAPRGWDDIRELLGPLNGQEPLARSFFTPEPPRAAPRYTGTRARWRYFGHACVLVETPHLSILSDPVLSYSYETNLPRYTHADLPEHLDFVLITHNHQDHILFETLLHLRRTVGTIVVPRSSGGYLEDPSMKLALERTGFRNVVELDEMETIEFEGGSITGLPFFGEHGDLDIRSKLAYLVRIGRRSMVFAADSCNIEPALYAHVHREIGDVDALFLGMECDGAPFTWYYGPLITTRIDRAMDQSRRLAGSNYEQAVNIVEQLGCKEAYVYAMGQEPWLNYVMSLKYTAESRPIVESNRLLEYCRQHGIIAERLFGEREMFLSD